MPTMPMPGRITIDGPAGSGKSTIGEQLAHTLGYLYVDTGAMYRALTWLALQKQLDLTNGPALSELARHADIHIQRPEVQDGRQYTVTVDGQDVTWAIRDADVTRWVSTVAAHPEVRAVLREWQRALGRQGHVIMVGRDIGAIVLPDAELKIYLTASLEERARRRLADMVVRNNGHHEQQLPSLQEVILDIERRDNSDRENMKPASDAIVVDTDHMSIPQVVDTINTYVQSRGETTMTQGAKDTPDTQAAKDTSDTESTAKPQTLPVKQATPSTSVAAVKKAVNLYDPYVTPRLAYNIFRSFAMVVFALVARVHIRGHYHLPRKGPYILAPNHLSWTDIPLVAAYVPGKVVYMAKEEYFSSRIAWLVRFLGAFPVKRGEGDRQALRTAEEQLKKGNVLVLFPEGTRSRTRTLAKGHAGLGMIALRSGVPVIPVAVWGSENALKKFGTPITISYGKPMTFKPKGKKVTREDIDNATETVMYTIASMMPPVYRGVYGDNEKQP